MNSSISSRAELAEIARALNQADIREDRRICADSLAEFVQRAWHVVEPAQPLAWGWPIEAVCMHLEAVSAGLITRLCINIPPGFAKSLLLNVFWPAWEWGPKGRPHTKYVGAAHEQGLAIRDNLRMRRLVASEWYQERWPVEFARDQNAKIKFENGIGGFKQASAAGSITGVRADRVLIDDPHSVDGANSDVQRESTVQWFKEAVPTRLVDPEKSAIVVIMQRLHEGDVSGVIIDEKLGYEMLVLPMEFDPSRACKTSIGFEDPRKEAGELLFPARFPRHVVERDKKVMGPYACNPGEAPILMSDLSMKPIREVQAGDEVVGFGKKPRPDGKGRMRLEKATVLAVYSREAPVVKMTLDSGEVIRCTRDHRWFRKCREEGRDWYGPIDMARGGQLARVCPTALPELSREDERLAGWLSGFFDGEGSVSNCEKRGQNVEGHEYRPSASISIFQGAGRNLPLCEKLEYALARFGFEFTYAEDERKPKKDAPCYGYRAYRLKSEGLPTLQRFLHIVQPVKWRDRIIDGAYGSQFIQGREKVVAIEDDGVETVYALKTTTGNYVAWGFASANSSGQLQQIPSPRGGGILKSEWWQLWDEPHFPKCDLIVASLDTAYGEDEENDPSALTIWGLFNVPKAHKHGGLWLPAVVMMRAWSGRLELHDLVEHVARMCKQYQVDQLLIEAKASGKSVAQEVRRLFVDAPWTIEEIDPGRIDKVARAYAVQPVLAAGMVWAPDKAWADMVIDQAAAFPKAKHDDLVDSMTQALRWFRSCGMLAMEDEVRNAAKDARRLEKIKQPPPLYTGIE